MQRIFSLDLTSLLEQININHGSWYAAIELASALFCTTMSKENHTQFAFMQQGQDGKDILLSLVPSADYKVHRDLDTPDKTTRCWYVKLMLLC